MEDLIKSGKESNIEDIYVTSNDNAIFINGGPSNSVASAEVRKRRTVLESSPDNSPETKSITKEDSWRRILLLIIAITVHNIPGENSLLMFRKSACISSQTWISS